MFGTNDVQCAGPGDPKHLAPLLCKGDFLRIAAVGVDCNEWLEPALCDRCCVARQGLENSATYIAAEESN